MILKNLIAEGTVADVYEQDGKAIKVFHEPHSKTKALREALTQARVEEFEFDFSVPSILSIDVFDGKWAIVMELVEGETLAELMEKNPGKTEDYLKMMAEIQNEINHIQVPTFHEYRNRLRRQVSELASVDDITKYDLLSYLDSAKRHVKLCHGNLEPSNVMISGNKVYVLNWVNATRGNASADAANTFVLLSLHHGKELANKYVELFSAESGISKQNIQSWIPIVAAARLTLGIAEERELLTRWINVVDLD